MARTSVIQLTGVGQPLPPPAPRPDVPPPQSADVSRPRDVKPVPTLPSAPAPAPAAAAPQQAPVEKPLAATVPLAMQPSPPPVPPPPSLAPRMASPTGRKLLSASADTEATSVDDYGDDFEEDDETVSHVSASQPHPPPASGKRGSPRQVPSPLLGRKGDFAPVSVDPTSRPVPPRAVNPNSRSVDFDAPAPERLRSPLDPSMASSATRSTSPNSFSPSSGTPRRHSLPGPPRSPLASVSDLPPVFPPGHRSPPAAPSPEMSRLLEGGTISFSLLIIHHALAGS